MIPLQHRAAATQAPPDQQKSGWPFQGPPLESAIQR
jgi:hypothetical protein